MDAFNVSYHTAKRVRAPQPVKVIAAAGSLVYKPALNSPPEFDGTESEAVLGTNESITTNSDLWVRAATEVGAKVFVEPAS
jgi:hypothetical protein